MKPCGNVFLFSALQVDLLPLFSNQAPLSSSCKAKISNPTALDILERKPKGRVQQQNNYIFEMDKGGSGISGLFTHFDSPNVAHCVVLVLNIHLLHGHKVYLILPLSTAHCSHWESNQSIIIASAASLTICIASICEVSLVHSFHNIRSFRIVVLPAIILILPNLFHLLDFNGQTAHVIVFPSIRTRLYFPCSSRYRFLRRRRLLFLLG